MKLASLENWDNGCTEATPEGVASVFLTSNYSPFDPLRAVGEAALRAFACGSPKEAKRICGSVPRTEFSTSLEYLKWAQFQALFLKSDKKGFKVNQEREATKKFVAAEQACKRANKRLRFYAAHPERENPLYRGVLDRAWYLIRQVLGNFTEGTLSEIIHLARPGGGMSVGSRSRQKVELPWKLGPETDLVVTPRALPYARMLVESSPHWLKLHAEVDWVKRTCTVPYVMTDANKVSFVPKDATTFRTIAVEPHLNMCLQLGVHEFLAKRLRAVNVDIRSQSRNQHLAKAGAVFWKAVDPLVTLDLSAASDSLCMGLVERLLPPTWVEFLDDLRSPAYRLGDADPVDYHKWSSMGNGYTFVLESLVFWALARACGSFTLSGDTVAVYGDDIILRRGTAALLIEVLKYCGFSVNTDKSAVFGPFRESCGEDYFDADRVVPAYLRGIRSLRPTDIYNLLNSAPQGVEMGSVRAYLLGAHRGRPILYGLPTSDPSGNLWTHDVTWLLKQRLVQWVPRFQAYVQRKASFRPYQTGLEVQQAYAAALFGAREITCELEERLAVKASLRQRGFWKPIRVIAG